MFNTEYVVWYYENGELKTMTFTDFDVHTITEIFEEDEVFKIEVVLC